VLAAEQLVLGGVELVLPANRLVLGVAVPVLAAN
jgi:hypothetical protein